MPKAFPEPGKGFPKSLEPLRSAVKGGIVADDVNVLSGASPVALDVNAYKQVVRSGATAGNEVVQLPSATEVGQKVLVLFSVEGNASDVVRINDDGTSSLQRTGIQGSVGLETVNKVIPATQYAAGTSVFAVSPVAGRIRRVRSVVDVVTAGAGAITLELATVEVTGSDVVIADSAAVGDLDDSGVIADSASNVVDQGEAIEVVGDGTPTAGEVQIQIEIETAAVAEAITNVDLDTPGEFALFEYQGGNLWNLLYTNGVVS